MQILKILILPIVMLLALDGCERSKSEFSGEPPAEILTEELESTPKIADGPIYMNYINSGIDASCIDSQSATQDLSKLGYEIVILIDKAPDQQTFRVFQKGKEIYSWLTSTGSEVPKIDKLGRLSSMTTPTGYFTPIQGRLYENYYSRSWEASMPYAIFIYGGVAIHETGEYNYSLLGQRASGGCLRLNQENAKTLFNLVKYEVGQGLVARVTKNGCLLKNSSGAIKYTTGYRTLIIVADSSSE